MSHKLGKSTFEADAERLRTYLSTTSGGSGGAPNDARYLTLATDTDLTAERVFTPGDGLDGTDGGAGSTYTLDVDLVAAWSGLEFSGGELRVGEDAAFSWTALHSFAAGITLNGASAANIITIPDNVAQAVNLVDVGGLEYLRIVSTNAQPVIDFNSAAADVDFHVGASGVADAFQVQGSDGQITLGALGAGFVQSTAGGVLSSAAIIAADLPAHTHAAGAGQGGSLVIGTTDTDATAGSVFFAGAAGVIQQDNAGLFYDNGNNTVGVRDNTPHAVADALYVPWITGDTQTTAVFGSSNASNDQTAIGAASYDAVTIIAQAQSSSAIGGATNSATATDFGVLGWATGAAGGVSAKSDTGTALYVNLTGAGTIAKFEDGGATVWSILDGGKLLCGATGTLDLNGVADALILDADGDTTISAPTDDRIDFEIAGADDFTMTSNSFNVLAGSSIYLSEYMYHLGDTNTYVRMETDKVTVAAGGVDMLEVVEDGANNYVSVLGAYFGVGITTPDKGIQLAGTDGNSSTMNFDRYQAGSAAPPSVSFRKSRNAAVGGLTIVQNGDTLGRFYFRGCDGTTMNRNAGYIDCVVDGVPGAVDMPGKMKFWTTPNGSGTSVERMAINNAGYVGIGISTALAQTHIDQAVTTAAIPVLALDQADVSEGFINFIGSDRGVITGATNSVGSVRAEINGTVYRLALYANA